MFFFNLELMYYIIIIGLGVCIMLFFILIKFSEENADQNTTLYLNFTHASLLESVWTIIPAIVLFLISIPSFTLLYSLDELIDPLYTIKILGHQWYWSYEFSDTVLMMDKVESILKEKADTNCYEYKEIEFDSYMLNTTDLKLGSLRLLEVDNRLVLPINTHLRLLITSADVLHSWAVPSLGIKVDACPGRLSQSSLFINRAGVYYGQCSEICGINHGFMPIVIKAVSPAIFGEWMVMKLEHGF